MYSKTALVLIVFLILVYGSEVMAQDSVKTTLPKKPLKFDPTLKNFIAANVMMGFPINQFHQKNNFNSGIGFSLRGGYRVIKEKPLVLGLSLEYMLRHKVGADGSVTANNGANTQVRTKVHSNVLGGHLFVHVEPRIGNVKFFPFIEGLAGFRHFYTRAVIINKSDNEEYDHFSLQKSVTLSFGGAAGISIPTAGGELEFRLMYLNSPKVKYVLGRTIHIQSPYTIDFEENTSYTPMICVMFGFSFSNL